MKVLNCYILIRIPAGGSDLFHNGQEQNTSRVFCMALADSVPGVSGGTLNNLVLTGFVQLAGFSIYPAKLCTECLLFGISWLVQNFIIFRKEKGQDLGCRNLVNGQIKA